MRINREEFLRQLDMVQPGLSVRDIVEQSSCFCFSEGRVFTYNDEIACSCDIPLDGITGAVKAEKLHKLLSKIQDEELEITATSSELRIRGKRKEAGITMEKEITNQFEEVEKPRKWQKLREVFSEAVEIVQQCAGSDISKPAFTCVHIHPKWIEACDNFQLCRYTVKTGFKESILVKRDSIKHIVQLGMTYFSLTDSWIHFKNPTGLVVSCRIYREDYPDLSSMLEADGKKMQLPKGLKDACETAEIFSQDKKEDNLISVELKEGKCRITGRSDYGWYREVKNLAYRGEAIKFFIPPEMLVRISEQHNECQITPKRLKVDGGVWQYVTTLAVPKEEKENE